MKNLLSAILFVIILHSCDSTEPPITPLKEVINNSIEIMEVWKDLASIKVKFTKSKTDTVSNYNYKLITSTGDEVIYAKIFGDDTSYTHTGLNEGQIVSFKVEAYEATNLKDTSNTFLISTLNPTSHNITWEIDTVGIAGNLLRDIWGIDENNVWAIGYVSLPEEETGIIKWNGNKWESFPSFAGTKTGIFGFSENDIWVVTGGTFGKATNWNGSNWVEYSFFPPPIDTVWGLYEIWGSSPDDVWAAGDNGSLIHWDGIEWTIIKTDISEEITALYGTADNDIYLAATSGNHSALYHYNGTEWLKENDVTGMYAITLWKKPGGNLIIGGTNFVEYTNRTYQQINIPGRTRGVIKVFGSDHNNIFTAGDFGEITHFDGKTWIDIDQFEVPNGVYRVLRSVWCTEKKVFLVGVDQNRAIIINGTIN